MQFILIGRDGDDSDALSRRLAAREAHLAHGDQLRLSGKLLYAAAMTDDTEKMIGSVMIFDFKDRAEFDAYLKEEPYVIGNVWKSVEVTGAKVGPAFCH